MFTVVLFYIDNYILILASYTSKIKMHTKL